MHAAHNSGRSTAATETHASGKISKAMSNGDDARLTTADASRMLRILSICAALSFLLVSSAIAQSPFGVCAADIKKTCTNVEPGKGRIAACVKEHLTELSDVCKARLAEIAAAGKTCRADVEKKCGTVRRRIQKVACIRNALTELGDDCKAAIAAVATAKK